MLQKSVFLCSICLLLIALAKCQNQPSNSHRIKEYYSNKCYSQTQNHTYYMRLSNEVNNFSGYLDSTFATISVRTKDFCDHDRRDLNNGFNRVVEYLQPCLPSQEKYFPEFLKTSFKEFLHFLCHNNGEYTERLFDKRNAPCRQNLVNVTSDLTACFGRIFKPRSKSYLTKTELCEDMSVAEKCFDQTLKDKCPHTSAYTDLSKTFFRYISKPCSGCITQVNILLLILSVTLHYLFNKK